MNIRLFYGRKDVLHKVYLKVLANRHNYFGVSIRKPYPKSVYHCSRVFILGVMQNNIKTCCSVVSCTIISFRAETTWGEYRGVIHLSNFKKISLVGQNIATGREKAKQKGVLKYKGCPTLTCDCIKTVIYRFRVHTVYITSNLDY